MTILFAELSHQSPEFDAAYNVFSRDIPSEFLEEKEFSRNRLRVRDEGPKSDHEKILVQDGYTLHLIAAKQGENVIGAIYGHLMSKIGEENRGVGFVTYISVLKNYRRQGIGSLLVDRLRKSIEQDSLRMTGKPIVGMVYEIETEGKEEIKSLVRKSHGYPLDITYYQPGLRQITEAEPMHLWFYPLDPLISDRKETCDVKYPVEFVRSMVLNLFTMEYVGPELRGFDLNSKPYTEFTKSLVGRTGIGYIISE
jgi:ribosomal protein S18 acetylase RimI-like enzyme